MASLLNRSGSYYATFTDSTRTPRQRRLSLKTRNKRVAARLLSKLDEAYALGEWDPWTGTLTEALHSNRRVAPKRVGEALELYLAHAAHALRPTTYKTRSRIVERFADSVGRNVLVERVSAANVTAFVGSGDAARSTQKTRLIGIKALFTFLIDNGHVAVSPAHAVRPPTPAPRLPRAVTDAELDAILQAIPESRSWTKPVFEFAALTGLRVRELALLEWRDVDEARRLLIIERQKNGKAGTQPIPRAALRVLQRLPHRSAYVFGSPREWRSTRSVESFANLLNTAFRDARNAAGIERPITPHGLRHRYCTKLAEAGASAFTIAAAARHKSIETSQVYVSISNRRLRAELDDVFS